MLRNRTMKIKASGTDRLVSDYIERSPAFSLGFEVQACRILGDRVALAVAKKVHPRDLTATPTARRVLELLEFAFSEPELIVGAENGHPAVTLFLAEFLSEYGMESSIRVKAGDLASRFRMLAKARSSVVPRSGRKQRYRTSGFLRLLIASLQCDSLSFSTLLRGLVWPEVCSHSPREDGSLACCPSHHRLLHCSRPNVRNIDIRRRRPTHSRSRNLYKRFGAASRGSRCRRGRVLRGFLQRHHAGRRVTGQLTVVAGNGTPGFSGDDGLATNAQLNQPAGIAVDLAGNLYIADTLNNRVRRVSHGVIATIAGDGTTAVMNMPLGIAVDISGNVYADSGDDRVLEISQGSIATVATLSPTIGCAGVAVSPNGTLYVSTSVNVYQMNDGFLVRVSQSPPPAKFEPVGIAVDANGRVYVADVGNHEIWQISNGTMTVVAGNGTSGYSGDNGPATLAELNGAQWVAVDAADNLYIADSMNNRIRKVTLGVITTIAGGYGTTGPQSNGRPTTSAQLNLPQGIGPMRPATSILLTQAVIACSRFTRREGYRSGERDRGIQRRWRGGYECAVESAAGRGGGWLRERLHHRFGQQSHPQSDAGRDYDSRREWHVGVQRRLRTGNRSSVERFRAAWR